MKKRDALWAVVGVALSAWFFDFTASPALALSITGTYTDIANGSPGTTGPVTGLVTGLMGPSGVSPFSSTGNHALDLFFADVHVNQSGIMFSCSGCLDPTSDGGSGIEGAGPASAAPEPTTLLLLGTTLVGLGAVVRRRMRAATKTAV